MFYFPREEFNLLQLFAKAVAEEITGTDDDGDIDQPSCKIGSKKSGKWQSGTAA